MSNMTEKNDYYELLGVSRDATQQDIKKAFRKLARECHPDVNQTDDGAEAKFKEINEAYQVLSDPEKRQVYDRYGHRGFDQSQGNSGGGFEDFGFGDIFDMFFGGNPRSTGRSGPSVERGNDLRYDLELTLEEAAHGVSHKIRLNRLETCETCNGTGAKPGSNPTTCNLCHGAGQVKQQQQSIFGTQIRITTCPKCHGEGHIIDNPCEKCHGQGRVRNTINKTVDIPAGVDTGMKVRFSGEGDAGVHGGPSGDLYVVTHIKPHKFLQRKNSDLWCEMTISFALASLGGRIEVPNIDNNEILDINPGTQPAEVYRLKGKGMPDPRNNVKGDLNVVIKIKTPTKLNDEQKKLLREFADSMGEDIKEPEGKSFFEQVKGMFN
jgi:molecular chaperone DnaJ